MSFIMPRAGNGIRQHSFMVVCSVLLMLLAVLLILEIR